MKSHITFQPISADVALAIAQQREGLLAQLSDEAYAHGIARLQQLLTDQSANYVLGVAQDLRVQF